MMKTRALLLALLVLAVSCALVLPAIGSQEQEDFVIVGADAVATRETGMSLTLPIPVELRFVLERADGLVTRDTQSVPEGMPRLLLPRFVFQRADRSRGLHPAYPCELVGEPDAPVISDLQVTDIQATEATISWSTDEYTDGLVEYGLFPGTYLWTIYGGGYGNSHSFTLTGLTSSTTYHYRVSSVDRCANGSTSADHSFTTHAPKVYLPVVLRRH